jgi:hypothetical protein
MIFNRFDENCESLKSINSVQLTWRQLGFARDHAQIYSFRHGMINLDFEPKEVFWFTKAICLIGKQSIEENSNERSEMGN